MQANLAERLKRHLKEGRSVRSFSLVVGVSEWKVRELQKQRGLKKAPWKSGELSESERTWVAACIDCEGTITIHLPWDHVHKCRNLQFYIRVNMVKRGIPERLRVLCGGSFRPKVRMFGKNRRDQFYWNISANGARWLLPQIIPYMYDKKRHAEIMLHILERNGVEKRMPRSDLFPLITELRSLNAKGKHPKPLPIPEGVRREYARKADGQIGRLPMKGKR